MTPQDLMDMPYAGMAEKQLRKSGMWLLTPLEKIEKEMDALALSLDDAQEAMHSIEHEMENLNETND